MFPAGYFAGWYFAAVYWPPIGEVTAETPPAGTAVIPTLTVSSKMTLASLRADVLRRLGDDVETVWTSVEIDSYLKDGYKQIARACRIFWDQTFLENLPRGFSYSQPWEKQYATFDYGQANYTFDDERRLGDEDTAEGPANHTCPDELHFLSDLGIASIPATSEVPKTVTEIERATWDQMTITALTPEALAGYDSRYQLTEGEVYGYTFRQDGLRTFRKIRKPAAMAAIHEVDGAWGILREPEDITSETVTGTWGIPRRIPGEHPIGTEHFGFPRRVYREGTNVKIEHWREGRDLDTAYVECELPDRYGIYLRDFALSEALGRAGPGQDKALAKHYQERWARALERMRRRFTSVEKTRVGVLGDPQLSVGTHPPRPRLPWNFPQRTRP